MKHAGRLAELEKRQKRRKTGELLPLAVLHPTMIDALGFTSEERAQMVYRATDAELAAWGLRPKENDT